MSVQGLQNPYQRLQVLPNTINWRGTWLVTQPYFKNDVVISPINGSSYILIGRTALSGGVDPSLSPNYQEISPLSTGITGILPGVGIDITGPPATPTITNIGVQTLQGDGVTVLVDNTDPQNPVISSTAISNLQQGPGITIDNTNPQVPIVSNTGVRQVLAADNTVSVNVVSPGVVSIASAGILSILQGPGISVTGIGNVTISNSGVQSFTPGNGIASTGGQNPTISNAGVLTIAPADSSIIVSGTAQNRILRTAAPVLSRIFTTTFSAPNDFTPKIPGTAQIFIGSTPALPNIFTDYLSNGAPDATGIFMIDLSEFLLTFGTFGSSVLANVFYVAFFDSVLNIEYVSAVVLNNSYLIGGQPYPITTSIGQVYFNVADARTAGMRTLSQIRVYNNTNANLNVTSMVTTVNGTYYPLGLQ